MAHPKNANYIGTRKNAGRFLIKNKKKGAEDGWLLVGFHMGFRLREMGDAVGGKEVKDNQIKKRRRL